ncbi:MAG TPA: SpoIID/LytB domain-containing protein [Longimicrobiales bacterium]
MPSAEPLVRVGVAVNKAEVVVGADGSYIVRVAGAETGIAAAPGERWTFTADKAGRLVGRGGRGRSVGPTTAVVSVVPRGEGAVVIGQRRYRGTALVRAVGPGRVTAVNVLELEAYLLGVVPEEIGIRPEAEIEAVKAQAVAARTYAIGNLGNREALGFDFYATVADQVYSGLEHEAPVVARAVRETRGEIVTYEGVPILAYYHSTCGGRTAAIEEVWPHAPLPYLRSVSDAIPGTDRYYCESSNRFRWTETWTGSELAAILRRTLVEHAGVPAGRVGRILGLALTGRTPSGRAAGLRVETDAGTYVVRGDSIRWILRPQAGRLLNSTFIELDVAADGGEVQGASVGGGGWGHGVGMCQTGALGRARAGQSYREILAAYYPDTRIERIY